MRTNASTDQQLHLDLSFYRHNSAFSQVYGKRVFFLSSDGEKTRDVAGSNPDDDAAARGTKSTLLSGREAWLPLFLLYQIATLANHGHL